jgi:hypothetical protein
MKYALCYAPFVALAALALPTSNLPAAENMYDGLLTYFPLSEKSGMVATDINGATAQFYSLFSQSPYWLSSEPGLALTYSSNQHLRLNDPSVGEGPRQAFTASAWIQLWSMSPTAPWQSIMTKGMSKSSYAFLVNFDVNNGYRLAFIANAATPAGAVGGGTWFSSLTLSTNRWYHVAITYDGSHVRFHLDGVTDPVAHAANLTLGSMPNEPLVIAADYPGAVEYFNGILSRMAIYERALSTAEVQQLKDFTFPKLSAAYAGLWIGYAELNEVQEVATGAWTPAPQPLYQKRLLHIDAVGNAHLLAEATLMKTRVSAPQLPLTVVISDPSRLTHFDGIVQRGGQLIGQRFSTTTSPVDAHAQRLHFVAGDNPAVYDSLVAELVLPAAHPLNPFRHKYHPDLRNGYAITRSIRLTLPPADSPNDNSITGTYSEEFTGLHKDTLRTRGPITFTRVSTAGALNP